MTKSSEFFRAARSQRWTSKTKPTELPEQDPSIFALYLDCLYVRTMPKTPALARPTYDATDDDSSDDLTTNEIQIAAHWEKLIALYVLACYLLDPITRNMTIDQIRRYYEVGKYDYSLKEEVINLDLRSTPDGDPLRNLFADFSVYRGEVTHTDLPKEWCVLLWERSLWLRMDGYLAVKAEKLAWFKRVSGPEGWNDHEYYDDLD
jgi:hypothetical protein